MCLNTKYAWYAHCYQQSLKKVLKHKILRGYCTSYQKLACFVLYLKIIKKYLKNKLCTLLFKELKNGIEISVGQAVFKL